MTSTEMNQFEFYKKLFEQEQSRKIDLDRSVNVPIAIASVYGAFLTHFISSFDDFNLLFIVVLGISVLLVLIGVFYLSKGYNNFLKGFEYKNLPKTKELFEYETTISKRTDITFTDYLVKNYVAMSDHNSRINRKRLWDLYLAKAFLIGSLTIAILTQLVLIIILIINKY